ncbi:MAG: FAD-dependent monooxygenase [Planctomycetes bacterium]|nr:FAD-dependent monooxygenase [Planctomycetota bacterium]
MPRPPMPEQTDVLIVGAGPGGLAAGKRLVDAAPGRRIMLIDTRTRIGSPLRCGELTYDSLFEVMGYRPRPRWVRWVLKKSNRMLVLDRPRMEYEMSRILERRGVRVCEQTSLVALDEFRDDGRWATLTTPAGPHRVHARLVIAADGVSSQTARLAGLATRLKPDQLCSCLAVRLTDARLREPDDTHYEFLPELAPFYSWIIPSGPRAANVGLGIPSTRGEGLEPLLDRLIRASDWIDGGSVTERIVGAYPSVSPLREPFADGLLVVGGAGRFVDAVTGEGIRQAAITGRAAAELALDLGDGPYRAADLASYTERIAAIAVPLDERARGVKRALAARPKSAAPEATGARPEAGHGARPAARRTPGAPSPKAVLTDLCTGCTGCVPICPPVAIHVVPSGIEVDAETCTGCGLCVKDCAFLGVEFADADAAPGTPTHPQAALAPDRAQPRPSPAPFPLLGRSR